MAFILRTRQITTASRGVASFRSMSTTLSNRQMFFVYAPDKTDEGTLQRRLSVRPKHLERSTKMFETGFIRVAGAMLTPESIQTPSSEKKMIGSVLILEAENMGAVRKAIEEDIYYTSGVWDPEKLIITPWAPAHFP